MAPPRSRSAPSKRNAAPPNPNPDLHAAVDEFNLHLLHAASEGDLRLLKRLLWALDKSRWDPREVVEAAKEEGVGALHLAAINGSLPVCRYLVEELGVDVDAVDDEAQTPLLWAIHGGSMDTVSYLLDHGANPSKVDDQGLLGALHLAARTGSLPVCRYLVEELGVDVDAVDDEARTPLVWAMLGGSMDIIRYLLDHGANPHKADDEGFTPLHHAAGIGDPEMMELLLVKGVYVDPVSVSGTPLHIAAFSGHDEAMKILLENNADCNKIIPGAETPLLVAITGSSVKCAKLLVEAGADVNDGLVTPLAVAANKGLTACLKCLLEAGANPDVPDPSGNMPIELAALNGTREDVEILFPVTSCIPTVHDWSIDGLMHHAKSVSMKQGEHSNARRIAELRSVGAKSIKRNDYFSAAIMYSVALEHDRHDATLLSNRSLCWLRMGDGHRALQDALASREMRPGWPKACYRQGTALMLLKDYGGACDAFLDAVKLDPRNPEIEAALREAMNSLRTSRGATKAT